MLEIKNLHVNIEDKEIIKGLDLIVKPGEVHAIMGPNGSGKSTLAYALAGHPHYQIVESGERKVGSVEVTSSRHSRPANGRIGNPGNASELGVTSLDTSPGSPMSARFAADSRMTKEGVIIDNQDLLDMAPDERAKAGVFLAFQYPVSIPGVTVLSFLKQAYEAMHPKERLPLFKFRALVEKEAENLGVDTSFMKRYLNEGFSGGEKKRVEILQMRVLKPKYAICDETDSGLDIDALKTVSKGIAESVKDYTMGCIVITHYQRILHYLKPDFVHVMVKGKIVKSGGKELVEELEREGYKRYLKV